MVFLTERQRKALETEQNTAVFYAGGSLNEGHRYNASDTANAYAEEVGKTTLDIKMDEAGMDFPQTVDREVGNELSRAYAEQASGDVVVFLGENDSVSSSDYEELSDSEKADERHPNNTWDKVECPTLLANEDVSKISAYDPATQEEQLICDRSQGDGTTEDMVQQYNTYLEQNGKEFRYGIGENGEIRSCADYALGENGHIKPEFDKTYNQYKEDTNMPSPWENLKEMRRERGEPITENPAAKEREVTDEKERTKTFDKLKESENEQE